LKRLICEARSGQRTGPDGHAPITDSIAASASSARCSARCSARVARRTVTRANATSVCPVSPRSYAEQRALEAEAAIESVMGAWPSGPVRWPDLASQMSLFKVDAQ